MFEIYLLNAILNLQGFHQIAYKPWRFSPAVANTLFVHSRKANLTGLFHIAYRPVRFCHHSITSSPRHFFTPSLLHSFTPSLLHSKTRAKNPLIRSFFT